MSSIADTVLVVCAGVQMLERNSAALSRRKTSFIGVRRIGLYFKKIAAIFEILSYKNNRRIEIFQIQR